MWLEYSQSTDPRISMRLLVLLCQIWRFQIGAGVPFTSTLEQDFPFPLFFNTNIKWLGDSKVDWNGWRARV